MNEEIKSRAKQFELEGKKYDIKVFRSPMANGGEEYTVQAFHDGNPASYCYSVKFTTNYDIMRQYGFDGISQLIITAESDVKNKYLEKYLEAKKQNEKS